MITEYGEIKDVDVEAYLKRLIGRIFKIIPMHEEGYKTLDIYVENLLRELIGNSNILLGDELLAVTGTLKGLQLDNHKLLKSDVFKALDIIDRVKERVG